jgi:1-deoxy-D-xylulose-5-phosphate reductoisomerase
MVNIGLKRAAITVLGSTGSIGVNTLDVVRRHPDRYKVIGLTAATSVELVFAQILEFKPQLVGMASALAAIALREKLASQGLAHNVLVLEGEAGVAQVAAALDQDCDRHKVMAAIVGGAGLKPTLAAARAGKQILLANKEAIVMAGHLFLATCQAHGAQILPIDSEHNAVFQCLPASVAMREADRASIFHHYGVSSIVLTASGGPFRNFTLAEMETVTPEQACAHPKWQMGRKISVDSATMMNKGLELIEAHHLFNVPSENLQVVFHPQSVIHSMVTYCDGSVLAQMGNPDMRTPIAHALAYPQRIESGVKPLNLMDVAKLEFEAPDDVRFPCLKLARQALELGGNAACVLNAANEVSVAAFLNNQVSFGEIARINRVTLDHLGSAVPLDTLDAVFECDRVARAYATSATSAKSAAHAFTQITK